MENDHSIHAHHANHWKTAYSVWLLAIGAVGAYFLLTQHFTHVVQALPFLLLLACPLMHLFMHHGHSGHGDRSTKKPSSTERLEHPQDAHSEAK
jgi:hypothetical protein